MGNKQSHSVHYPEEEYGYDPNHYVTENEAFQDPGQSGRKRRGLFGRRRVRDDDQQVVMDPGQEASYPPEIIPTQRPHYMQDLTTRPSILIHLPTPPSSLSNPPNPISHPAPMQSFHLPLPVNPSYTPRRAFHPPQTVRIPKPGTWMLRNVRAGGQGVKRGQFEGLKEGTREMKELRKRARAAERLRRHDDACREYASPKIQTEQDIYRQSRRQRQEQALPGLPAEPYPQPQDPPTANAYSNVQPEHTVHFAQVDPGYGHDPEHPPGMAGYADPPAPVRSRSIWRRSAFKPKGDVGSGGGRMRFKQKHGMMRDEEVRDY